MISSFIFSSRSDKTQDRSAVLHPGGGNNLKLKLVVNVNDHSFDYFDFANSERTRHSRERTAIKKRYYLYICAKRYN